MTANCGNRVRWCTCLRRVGEDGGSILAVCLIALLAIAVIAFLAVRGKSDHSHSDPLTAVVDVVGAQPKPLFSQTIYVRGGGHQSSITKKSRQSIYSELQRSRLLNTGQRLRLLHEQGNRFDENAILVIAAFGESFVDLGYLPASMSSIVRRTGFQDGHTFVVRVLAIEKDKYQPQSQVVLISLDRYGKSDRHPKADELGILKRQASKN